jgi:hypothetical protein
MNRHSNNQRKHHERNCDTYEGEVSHAILNEVKDESGRAIAREDDPSLRSG